MFKKLILPVIVVGVIAVGIVLALNNDCEGEQCTVANIAATPTPTPTAQQTIVQQVSGGLSAGGLLIDVRTPEEFAEAYAKDAINLALTDLEAGTYPDIAKDTAIYLYCRSGNRAEQAKTILEQAGFTNAINIGSLADWQAQGGEVISS